MKEKLKDQIIFLGSETTYTLPSIEDEEGLPIKVTPQPPLPSYAEYDSGTKTFKFAANKTKDVGKQFISVCFSDGYTPE